MFKESNKFEKFESKVWLSSPTMHGPEIEYVKEAYETNWMSTVGKNINEVEKLACEYIGCKYAVALSAGTASLHLAMKLAGIEAYGIRWMLVLYDLLVYELSAILLLGLYGGNDKLSTPGIFQQMLLALLCVFATRLIGNVYGQIWRYGGIQCYIRLLYTDAIAFFIYLLLEFILPVEKITFARMLCLSSINLLGALTLRMIYRYAYKYSNQETKQN